MIRGRIRYACDVPGCHCEHHLSFKAHLHIKEIDPPEGWGEDENGRILCPNHYHPAPVEPAPAHLQNVYKIMGKTYLSMNALISLMTTNLFSLWGLAFIASPIFLFGVTMAVTIQLLEPDDIMERTDWCRPLVILPMSSQGDFYSFRSCYGGGPENNVKWVKVEDYFGPFWKNKPIREFLDNPSCIPMEFARGPIPKEHQLDMSKYTSMKSYWE